MPISSAASSLPGAGHAQPLAGVRAVEFCSIAAGPFCAMLLADLGADVLKIEPPDGDALRQWPPLPSGFSENFVSLNRDKRSIVLDLKLPADVESAASLIEQCDVVIENNRPGVMDRLGLGYARFAQSRPDLIYCSISAFGQIGPRAAEGGFDLTIQVASGIMSVIGQPEGSPVKCGVPVADFASGLYATLAVSAALARVTAGGRGAHIDVPMFGCSVAIAALQTSEYFGTDRSPGRLESAQPRNAPYQAFRAANGCFAIAAGNENLWLKVCRVVGAPELALDKRFSSTRQRAIHQGALKEILEATFLSRPVDTWIEAFAGEGVPHSRINDYASALADPQTSSMRWIREVALPGGHTTRTFVSRLRFDGALPPDPAPPPALDEHQAEIRREFGIAAKAPHGE